MKTLLVIAVTLVVCLLLDYFDLWLRVFGLGIAFAFAIVVFGFLMEVSR